MSLTVRAIVPAQTYALRHLVLWPDQPLTHVALPEDADGHHFGAFADEELVSVISLFVDARGQARFRKFATHPAWQGQGIGTVLLTRVLAVAVELGAQSIWCDARQTAATFYQRFGMQPEGEVFCKGPIPYLRMSRLLP